MSRAEQHERRQRMAAAVAKGESLGQVAQREKVSLVTVREACRMFDVSFSRVQPANRDGQTLPQTAAPGNYNPAA